MDQASIERIINQLKILIPKLVKGKSQRDEILEEAARVLKAAEELEREQEEARQLAEVDEEIVPLGKIRGKGRLEKIKKRGKGDSRKVTRDMLNGKLPKSQSRRLGNIIGDEDY